MASNFGLRLALQEQKKAIDEQIQVVSREAKRAGVEPNELRLADGSWVLIPLMTARAQVLSAMAYLAK